MNRGMIFGTVRNSTSARVSLTGLYAGHIANKLTIWNPTADNHTIHAVHTKNKSAGGYKHSVFTLPFRWDAHNLGDIGDARFRVFAVDRYVQKSGVFVGNIRIYPDWHRIALDAVESMFSEGVLKLAKKELAAGMNTAFGQGLAIEKLWALGLALIDVE